MAKLSGLRTRCELAYWYLNANGILFSCRFCEQSVGEKCWTEGVFRAADFHGGRFEVYVLFPDSSQGRLCVHDSNEKQRPIYHKLGEQCSTKPPVDLVRGGRGPELSMLPQVNKRGGGTRRCSS